MLEQVRSRLQGQRDAAHRYKGRRSGMQHRSLSFLFSYRAEYLSSYVREIRHTRHVGRPWQRPASFLTVPVSPLIAIARLERMLIPNANITLIDL
jgi:hypothetical protein